MNDLSWNNFLDLLNFIESHDKYVEQFLSPLVLVTLPYYGISIKYHIEDNMVFLFVKYSKDYISNSEYIPNLIIDKWLVSQIFYEYENFDIPKILQIVKNKLISLNQSDEIIYSNISKEMVNDLNIDHSTVIEEDYVSNYIYDLDSFKTFAGNKLQKKRNHLNAFMKANYNLKIVNIRQTNQDEILIFLNDIINNFSEIDHSYELEICKEFLNNIYKDEKFLGIVIYIDRKIVALTLGYLRKNIYDVIIEKAYKQYRGIYQYLIKTNLIFNEINVKFMDREDDLGLEYLAKSKHSYNPLLEIKRYKSYNNLN